MNDIEYIFFDVGYTLVDETEVWSKRCSEQAMTDEGRALGLSAEDIMNEVIAASVAYKPQFRTVIDKYGFNEAAPYRHELETLYPDAPEVLEHLGKKYKLGIIANQVDGLSDRLSEFGILEYFSVVISSWDCGAMKPDSRIFEYAFERSGCAPEKSVMIGDRLDNDIFPAKKLGMKTVWIKQGFGGMQSPLSEEYVPDREVMSLTDLIKLM